MHAKALDTADQDKAFALGFWICRGRISEKLEDSAAYSALEKAFVPCFENTAPGARGRPANPKGAFVPKPKIFPRTHTHIRIKSSKMSSNKKSRAKAKAQ